MLRIVSLLNFDWIDFWFAKLKKFCVYCLLVVLGTLLFKIQFVNSLINYANMKLKGVFIYVGVCTM